MGDFIESVDATAQRMATLEKLSILDTPAESNFDDVVFLATQLCQTPVALVSLVADDRQWFKARLGFPPCETPLDQSVCKYAMSGDDVFVIPDLELDPRTKDNTLVTGNPFIRFYAGAPLVDPNGVPIGSLCVIDTETRPDGLTPQQKSGLKALARQVMAALEARRLFILQGESKDAQLAATASELATARHAGELREQFAAILGHDLRNSLSAIIGGLHVLEKTTAPERAARVVGMMKQSTVRMTELIENTLDFARTKLGGGINIKNDSPEPLRPVLDHIVSEVNAAWPERVIETRMELAEPVYCDSARIGQLFSNLLSNAVTYGDKAKPIIVSTTTANRLFVLSVANGGRPIPPASLESLFQPFAQGENPERRGLGLGLYIAAEIARGHDGTLSATSTEEQTKFVFQMPLRPEQTP